MFNTAAPITIKLNRDQMQAWNEIKVLLTQDPDWLDLVSDEYELNDHPTRIEKRAISEFEKRLSVLGTPLEAIRSKDKGFPVLRKGVIGDGFYGFEVYLTDLILNHVEQKETVNAYLSDGNGQSVPVKVVPAAKAKKLTP